MPTADWAAIWLVARAAIWVVFRALTTALDRPRSTGERATRMSAIGRPTIEPPTKAMTDSRIVQRAASIR